MPTGLEVIRDTTELFREIQKYMELAQKENAKDTYAELKRKYMSLKALLQAAGVNLTDIDELKL